MERRKGRVKVLGLCGDEGIRNEQKENRDILCPRNFTVSATMATSPNRKSKERERLYRLR